MVERRVARSYEPPKARDLSRMTVAGDTKGWCQSGGTPYTECKVGGSPVGAGCQPVGNFESYPKCGVGSVALSGCEVGSSAG